MGGIALILYPLTAFACGLTSGVAGFALGLPIFSGSPLAAPQRRLRGQTVLRATNGKFLSPCQSPFSHFGRRELSYRRGISTRGTILIAVTCFFGSLRHAEPVQ
jgi:hypothetical protein